MTLRKYKSSDCPILAELFYNTVHTINAKDYTKSELNSWAGANIDLSLWDMTFLKDNTIIAEIDNIILGFGNMDNTGYLDKLYVHKDYQNKGIATAILTELEKQAIMNGITSFTTHSSITSKTFFEKNGYIIKRNNVVMRNNIALNNFIMEKVIYD